MRLLAADDAVRQSGSKVNTEQFRTCAIAMPKLNSKLSRKLANVKEQLKKGTTRGRCPRPLTLQEIQNLEARRKELQEAMVKARLKDREDPVIAAPASPLPESEKDGGSKPEGADEEEDIPAAPPSGEGEEEAEEEEKEEPRPEATELVAQAPAESFATNLAKRAAEALAKQRGIETPPLPPSWFEDHVMAFYSRSDTFRAELRDVHDSFHAEVINELTLARKRCRRCKREGHCVAEPDLACERHDWPPEDYFDRLKRLEAPVYDKFAAEAAQWALDRKSADDKLAMERQKQEEDKRLERVARQVQALESMEPLCLRCASCFHLDFGVLGQGPEQMCGKHQEQYWLAVGP